MSRYNQCSRALSMPITRKNYSKPKLIKTIYFGGVNLTEYLFSWRISQLILVQLQIVLICLIHEHSYSIPIELFLKIYYHRFRPDHSHCNHFIVYQSAPGSASTQALPASHHLLICTLLHCSSHPRRLPVVYFAVASFCDSGYELHLLLLFQSACGCLATP